MATMNVSVPDPMKDWVQGQIATGKYANASDYVRHLIRRDQEKVEVLRRTLLEGDRSGVSRRKVEDIMNDVKKRCADHE
ncbi:type II toxin-antitoxin system ParD family antitoxin [Candidatus Nitrospira allomarina]|uniref:Type II toxin-antitoxin system ParD family antitoxin n=1 Tax=Candidatus Nitrospira allomarina TaxID=3020900 RepID=A0AA96JRU1_9BACT|nr:type II toxin-antitoxin system ParD family antitoxin [Candidatus Nitrospira allomarina]WNM57478.1 type II toxin-antitoxin system ParD family antitoxin [Candidatus Nitrospira allomarina]